MSAVYVEIVIERWGAAEPLPVPGDGCRLCHQSDAGGADTATQPFARSLLDRGLVGGGLTRTLESALDELERSATDTDADCVSDYDELRAGSNPSVSDLTGEGGAPSAPAPAFPVPHHGCALGPSSPLGVLDAGVWLALGVVVAGRALSRRSRTP